ncbi:SWIM zinc finger family protein [Streptomyces sp. 351MFTsu5.1]|uniref:SWIM zinc finger family protein n=1 Tax=Streptomyces sp. 351MFTsu5.1 TaxID=1172180 RepID=UPI000377CDB6|nr:SWIM zinc finger family protein [Streptomyces sp. 351MFTsu5.1]
MTPGPADEARRALRAARERATGAADGADTPAPEAAGHRETADSAAPDPRSAPAEEGGAARAFTEADRPGEQGSDDSGAEKTVKAPAPPDPRPGDAARAALRKAVSGVDHGTDRSDAVDDPSAAATSEETDRSREADRPPEADRSPEAVPPPAAAPLDNPPPPDPRPADAAREALRAARKKRAEIEAAEAEAALVRRSRRATAAPPRDRARTLRPASDGRARDVRAPDVRARDVRELLADAFRMPDDMSGGPVEGTEDNGPARQDSSGRRPPGVEEVLLDTTTLAPTPTGTDSTAPAAEPPSMPRHPRSMAAPNRDNDLRRTFPAFPPHPSGGALDARFAATWWGNAWVTALEEGALDAKRLARGRSYAEQGHVDAITVTPGLVLAYVQGSRPRPYRVQVRLRTLDAADWDRFLDLAADRTGHIAALLDREMPQSLAECGVPLLPGPGDLEPQCSCPDRGHPCKHAAALCYQTARLLDADPFVLLLLRGRGERELLDDLSRLSAARAARAAQEREPAPVPGVRASEVLASRRLPPLPAPLPAPPHPEQPPAYPASPGGPDPFALDQLATDAAARAHTLLGTGHDPVGELTLWQDAVRLAAARPGSGLTAGTRALYVSLAGATGRTPADLARAVAAWRQGGLEGLAVLEEPWDPPAGRFDRARPLLLAADLPAFRPWRNHLTHPRGHVQLRLGRDGLWYAYESEPGHDDWWPRGTPDLDPVGALTGLGTQSDL